MTSPQGAPREAGRLINERIAVDLMGWADVRPARSHGGLMGTPPGGGRTRVPAYSTDIAAAWTVAEKLARLDPHPWMLTLKNWNYYGERTYSARFTTHPLGPPHVEESAASPALAICLAALAALTPHPTPKETT